MSHAVRHAELVCMASGRPETLKFMDLVDKLRYTYIISVTLAILSSLLMITGVFSSAFSWIPSSLLGALIGLIIDRKKPSMPS